MLQRPCRKLSLMVLALLLCCALVMLPIMCSVIYFKTAVTGRLEKNARETASFYLSNLADQTSSTLSILRDSIYYLMSDDAAQRLMRSSNGAADQTDRLTVEQGLNRAFFLGSQLSQQTVTGIYLISSTQECIPLLRGGAYLGSTSRVQHVYDTLGSCNSALNLYQDTQYPDYCYMIVDYFDLGNMHPLGKIIIELHVSGLVDTSYLDALYSGAVVALRSSDGTLLSQQDDMLMQAADYAPNDYIRVKGRSYYHTALSLSPVRAQIDVFIPRSEILEASNQTIRIYILFSLLVLLLTLAGGGIIVYFLGKPLKQMLHSINDLSSGNLSARMGETPYRETEYLSAAFNNMADHLESLFDEVYQQGILLREAEFKLLESQIRPHFIFNILELINIRCLEAGENHICHIVSNLAQLLRANITHKHEQVISFQEELRYVRYYLELQKERFGEQLSYSIDLESPAILQYSIPKLTIQPLVENSIVHGLEPKCGGGEVRVSIWEEENEVYLRVSDNGVGFEPETLHNQPAEENTARNHIALDNISRRIRLLYGTDAQMTVNSAPGKGTQITISLPIIPYQPSKEVL